METHPHPKTNITINPIPQKNEYQIDQEEPGKDNDALNLEDFGSVKSGNNKLVDSIIEDQSNLSPPKNQGNEKRIANEFEFKIQPTEIKQKRRSIHQVSPQLPFENKSQSKVTPQKTPKIESVTPTGVVSQSQKIDSISIQTTPLKETQIDP